MNKNVMMDYRASAYLIMSIFVAFLALGGAKKLLDYVRNIQRVRCFCWNVREMIKICSVFDKAFSIIP